MGSFHMESLYKHIILDVEHCTVDHYYPEVNCGNFKATVRIDLRSEEEAIDWLEHFKASSFLDFTINDSYRKNTPKINFKKGYSCYLNRNPGNRYKTHHTKHINCPANLMVTVKNWNMKESIDKYWKSHPAEVRIHFCHNHPILASDALRHRKPSPAVQKTFCELFLKVMTFTAPKLQWCYYQFYKSYQKAYGSFTGDKMYEALESAVKEYNTNMGCVGAKLRHDGKEVVLAFCTSLMRRVHSLKSSGEIAFVDTDAGCVDRDNFRILLMVTYSICGALPLGLIILSSETEAMLTNGLSILMSILPDEAFNGRGKKGPTIVNTDDCQALRNSLRKSFSCQLLLCKFHVLQAFWDYVWDAKHEVKKMEDRGTLFNLFKGLVNQKTVDQFEENFQCTLKDDTLKKYSKVLKHVQDLYARAAEWAMCYREALITRGNDTNNYVESKFRSLKDFVMQRCKAFSIVQLFDFLITRFPAFYERRISDVLNNCAVNYTKSKYFFAPKRVEFIECQASKEHPNQFDVFNTKSKKKYVVDMDVETCTCPAARGDAPCKHLYAVVQKFNLSSSQVLSFSDEKMKKQLHFVMIGCLDNVPDTLYQSIQGGNAHKIAEFPHESGDFAELKRRDSCDGTQADAEANNTLLPLKSDSEDLTVKIAHFEEKLDEVYQHLKSNIRSSPDGFIPAVDIFHEKYFRTVSQQSQNALTSALHSFNSNLIGPKCMLSGRYINVSKKAVARRQTPLVGSKLQRNGRPTKRSYAAEHEYATSGSAAVRKLPHKLSSVVDHKTKKKCRSRAANLNAVASMCSSV